MNRPAMPNPEVAGGYPILSGYTATLQSQIAPAEIDLAMLACSRQPPLRAPTFRYAELGCGRGATLVALAAVYPDARFYGFDLSPEHVAWARRLASDAAIENVVFEEADFATLVTEEAPEPRFDYVALHGVYSWISAENRIRVAEILDRWVTPGGAVYMGCNAMPGWAGALPIRRIFRDVLGSTAPSSVRIDAARAAVEMWLAQAGSLAAQVWWDRLSPLSNQYLVHEFGAAHADATWSAELREEMALARLDHVGPAFLIEKLDELRLDETMLPFVRQADSAGFGLTARDLALERSFLTEIFSRGAPALTLDETAMRFGEMRIEWVDPVLTSEKDRVPPKSNRALDRKVTAKLKAGLKGGPRLIADLAGEAGLEPRRVAQAAVILLATGQARTLQSTAFASAAQAGAKRFNAAARRRHAEGAALPGLVSPVLGTAVPLTAKERDTVFSEIGSEQSQALARLGIENLTGND